MTGLKRRNCLGKGEIAVALKRRNSIRSQLRVSRPIRAQLCPPAGIGPYYSCKLVVGQHGLAPFTIGSPGSACLSGTTGLGKRGGPRVLPCYPAGEAACAAAGFGAGAGGAAGSSSSSGYPARSARSFW